MYIDTSGYPGVNVQRLHRFRVRIQIDTNKRKPTQILVLTDIPPTSLRAFSCFVHIALECKHNKLQLAYELVPLRSKQKPCCVMSMIQLRAKKSISITSSFKTNGFRWWLCNFALQKSFQKQERPGRQSCDHQLFILLLLAFPPFPWSNLSNSFFKQ